jgi:hypothetical protein
MKGPIAIFEQSIASMPATISVFETLQDKHDTRPKPSHRGVPLGLLDYLLVTSLFLVTDVYEWIAVEKAKGKPITVPPIDGNGKITIVRSIPYLASTTSAEQWRRVTLSEEFDRGAPSSSASVHGTSASSSSLMSTDEVLATMDLRDRAQSFQHTFVFHRRRFRRLLVHFIKTGATKIQSFFSIIGFVCTSAYVS